MKERDYVKATDLAKLRIASRVLRDVLLFPDDVVGIRGKRLTEAIEIVDDLTAVLSHELD